jgi:hypothetical protein
MYGIRSLYKRAWQGSLVPFLFFPHFCHVKTHCFFLQEEAVLSHHLGAQSGPHQTDKPADSLILDFSASRAVRNQFWFFFFINYPPWVFCYSSTNRLRHEYIGIFCYFQIPRH